MGIRRIKTIIPKRSTEEMVADGLIYLREAHKLATSGNWRRGETSHESVAYNVGRAPYHLASYRHSDDAQFAELSHQYVPYILDALQSAQETIKKLNQELQELKDAKSSV